MSIFDQLESSVQSYARSFPRVFESASGSTITDEDGNRYIDFLSGAGSLNYGHNHPVLKQALQDYIARDGITHGLDMHTGAKAEFLQALRDCIFEPRGLDYRVQFTGPTGANAVEAALKLARKVTGRENVIAFTNGFHGVTLGALAATGNGHHRGGAGISLGGITRMPFENYLEGGDSLAYLRRALDDNSSGVDLPAAVLVECIQGEGGLNAASSEWLRGLERLCRERDILLIVDDIQAGCGRSGDFFSFEESGISPDLVTLSKSLGGMGLPLAVTLIRRDLDEWKPGEHNGTFRGNNHAFVTGAAALRHFWSDDGFIRDVRAKIDRMTQRLDRMVERFGDAGVVRRKGRGLMQGLECSNGEIASAAAARAFEKGLVIEMAGPDDEVIKCLVALTMEEELLERGLDLLEESLAEVLEDSEPARMAS